MQVRDQIEGQDKQDGSRSPVEIPFVPEQRKIIIGRRIHAHASVKEGVEQVAVVIVAGCPKQVAVDSRGEIDVDSAYRCT